VGTHLWQTFEHKKDDFTLKGLPQFAAQILRHVVRRSPTPCFSALIQIKSCNNVDERFYVGEEKKAHG